MPSSRKPRVLRVAMFAGGVTSPSIILWNIAPPVGLLLAIFGAIGGAALGAILVGPFVHDAPRPIAPASTCPACGEPSDGLLQNCPVCGELLKGG
jgi:hypothetical protein